MDTLSEREAQYWLGYERTKAKEPSVYRPQEGDRVFSQCTPYTRIERYEAKMQETA